MSDLSRRLGRILGPALLVLAIPAAASFGGSYLQSIAGQAAAAAAIGAALVLLVGMARVITLASGAMMGLGAYAATIASLQWGWGFLTGLPLALAIGAVAGFVLALPSLRFQNHYVAMVTMVFQYVVVIVLREAEPLTGGALGLRVPAPGWGDLGVVWLLGLGSALWVAAIAVLAQGRFGDLLRAAAASEVCVTAFGGHAGRLRVAAFVVSSAAIATVGALQAPLARILDPESFGITHSILMLGYPVLGGMTSVTGGVLGGSAMRLLPELLRGVHEYQELLLALLVLAAVLVWPGGLASLLRPFARRAATVPPATPRATNSMPPSGATVAAAAEAPTGAVPALAVSGLRKRYDALLAVDGLELTVAAGSIHGVIGPNGAGKTSLFNALSGLDPADDGTIRLFGQPVEHEPARLRLGRGMTRTFQHVATIGGLSVRDNVLLGLGRNGVGQACAASLAHALATPGARAERDAADRVLEQVGLGRMAALPAAQLSIGDQRRLEIARALVSGPRLLLLDEPVAGVPQADEERLLELLRRMNAETGITILLVEHNLRFVRRMCHRVSVMANGRLIAEDHPEAAIASPAVRALYLGSAHVEPARGP